MSACCKFSYFLLVAIALFGFGPSSLVFGEECNQDIENKLYDQHFGLAITPEDILTNFATPWIFRDYMRPWRHLAAVSRDLGSTIKMEKDKFQINLDMQHFSPEEITVKTADGYIVIEGKHEEKKDEHGFVSRQFVRRYSLPEGASPESVVSQLSADGVLTVTAPRKEIEKPGERIVPITPTGPVRKENKEAKETGSCYKESCKAENK